jgi:hypothetical protein
MNYMKTVCYVYICCGKWVWGVTASLQARNQPNKRTAGRLSGAPNERPFAWSQSAFYLT